MKKILLLVSLFTTLIIAQPFQIKQITNLNADCRNFYGGHYLMGSIYYTFEAHKGNSSDIYLGQYSPAADSFSIIANVTNDNFMNINPKLLYSNDSLLIIYQTNKNGNWDIAYRVFFNNNLSPVYYAADSSADEINPVVTTINEVFWSRFNQSVSYEKGNSVFIKDVHIPNSIEIEIFKGNDSTKYTQVSQEYNTYNQSDFYITARKVASGKSFIVYKHSTGGWDNEIILVNKGNCQHPKIHQHSWMLPLFSYTDDMNGKSNIILIENLSQPIDTLMLFDYPLYNYDNFWILAPQIVFAKKHQFYNDIPYTYSASNNDSLFIRLNTWDMPYVESDTLLYTKINDNNLYMGSFGETENYEVYYTVWEDSISGNIQLLGKRCLYFLDDIKDNDYSPSSFTLYQNYPNPFNPTTTISYRLKETGFVKLNVYTITGKLIKTLVSQTQNPGSYETQFNAKGLASGIYFYRLEIFTKGSSPAYSEIKKLVLLK